MKNLPHVTILVALISLLLAACSPLVPVINVVDAPTVQPGTVPQTTSRPAQVQSVQIQIMNTDPPQVNAVVHGSLSESCASLGESRVQYASNTFQITVNAVSPTDRGCAQVTAPFDTTIALDIAGLPAGTYTVVANGVSTVFTLQSASPAPTAAPTVAPTSQACTDSAAFVADVTMPDNILVAPGVAFTKTWRLKNTGSCAWDSSYLVAYISGATMSQQPGYWILQAGQSVEPGHTVDISVGMTSPVQDGTYSSYWGLKNPDGRFMPVAGGANGNSFYVKIRVPDTRPQAGSIVAQSIDIELEQGSGEACTPGATYLVHAYITADGPLSAGYQVDSSAGQIPAGNFVGADASQMLVEVRGVVDFDPVLFEQGGTRTITLPFRFVGPYPHPDDITVMVRADGQSWVNAKLPCP